jgi:hypothetical protein
MYLALFYVYADLNKEKKKVYKQYWKDIKAKDKKMHRKMKYGSYFVISELFIGPIKRLVTKIVYKIIIKKTLWN